MHKDVEYLLRKTNHFGLKKFWEKLHDNRKFGMYFSISETFALIHLDHEC